MKTYIVNDSLVQNYGLCDFPMSLVFDNRFLSFLQVQMRIHGSDIKECGQMCKVDASVFSSPIKRLLHVIQGQSSLVVICSYHNSFHLIKMDYSCDARRTFFAFLYNLARRPSQMCQILIGLTRSPRHTSRHNCFHSRYITCHLLKNSLLYFHV